MRSRYTAYTLMNTAYLAQSWHPGTRPETLGLDRDRTWTGLKIKRVEKGGPGDDDGVVEFDAKYKIGGKGYRLREVSRFARVAGRWVYLDAIPDSDANE
jgi:SEC-C motif-containing protein